MYRIIMITQFFRVLSNDTSASLLDGLEATVCRIMSTPLSPPPAPRPYSLSFFHCFVYFLTQSQSCKTPVTPHQHGVSRQYSFSTSKLSGMRIHRLPEDLAPPPRLPGTASAAAVSAGVVTGVRVPAFGYKRRSLRPGQSVLPGLDMTVDRPCVLFVCFHDASATAGGMGSVGGVVDDTGRLGEGAQELPTWATELGLIKSNMKVCVCVFV